MCGIAGFCGFDADYTADIERWGKTLVDMRLSLAHRGNDNTGEYLDKNVGLSHTRLSIRDLVQGAQPMTRAADGNKYVIVYNGEIYNAEELKSDLVSQGYSFETTSDTEVILNCYIRYGEECVKMLNGIFAFAVWNERRQTLTLFRDRVGIKPLFYTLCGGELVFASEIKGLFCHPKVTPKVNLDSFREIFGVGPARTPGCGVFEGVNELKAGHYAVFSRDGFDDKCYWEFTAAEHTDSYAKTVETVRYLVCDSIERQLVSDVPVCSFLSGGLDSCIVTSVAAKYLKNHGASLNTFSFDFAGNDKYFQSNSFQPERDKPYVEIMAAYCGTDHTCLECDEERLAEMLVPAMTAKDLPGMADVDASLLYFCSLVKRHNKVTLTGECADEIFGGYPWFYREELINCGTFPWSRSVAVREQLLTDEFCGKLQLGDYVEARYSESVSSAPTLAGESDLERNRRIISYLNQKWFMTTLLDRMDRTSMYSALEARVPFADHRIVEYMFNVPWHMKYRDGVEKALLRDACADLLPPEIAHRKKSPYPKTYNPNYKRLLSRKLTDIINSSDSPVMSFIDRKKALSLINSPEEFGKPWFGQLMAGTQMMAYIIQIDAWMRHYHLSI